MDRVFSSGCVRRIIRVSSFSWDETTIIVRIRRMGVARSLISLFSLKVTIITWWQGTIIALMLLMWVFVEGVYTRTSQRRTVSLEVFRSIDLFAFGLLSICFLGSTSDTKISTR
jgi:hypothetical protein